MGGEPTNGEVQRMLGRLEARVDGLDQTRREHDAVLDRRFDSLKTEMKSQGAQLDEIRTLLAQGRGGWRVIVTASAVVGMIGSLIGAPLVKRLFGG